MWQAASYFLSFAKFAQTSPAKKIFLEADSHVSWSCQRFIDVGSSLRWLFWSFHSVLEFFLHFPHRSYYKKALMCTGSEFIIYSFYAVVMFVPSRTCSLLIFKWLFYCHIIPPLELCFLEFLSLKSSFKKKTDVWDSLDHLSIKSIMPQEIKNSFLERGSFPNSGQL